MKSIKAILLAAGLCLGNAYSTNISTDFYWAEDSLSAFSVTIVGKGLTWHDTFISPSGLWGFDITLQGEYRPQAGWPQYPINVADWGSVGFLPTAGILLLPGYNDFFAADAPVFDSNHLSPEGLPKDWTGFTPYVITSMADPSDNSTWEWVLNIYAHGTPMHVPESGGILCTALGAGLLLLCFRPKFL